MLPRNAYEGFNCRKAITCRHCINGDPKQRDECAAEHSADSATQHIQNYLGLGLGRAENPVELSALGPQHRFLGIAIGAITPLGRCRQQRERPRTTTRAIG